MLNALDLLVGVLYVFFGIHKTLMKIKLDLVWFQRCFRQFAAV